MTEVCVESVLDVLGTGIPVVAVVVNPYNRFRGNRNGVSRQALAKFLIGVLLDPSWKIHSIGTFDFIGEHDWHYQALYAALAAARTPVANLSTHGCFFRQDDQLQLLAKALFSPRSSNQAFYPPIHGLDILYEKADLETIVAAIKEKESGFMTEWQLREGTPLIFAQGQASDGAVVTKHALPIPVDTHLELLSSSTGNQRSLVEVILPATANAKFFVKLWCRLKGLD